MNEPVTLHTSTYPQPLALSVSAYSARGAKPVNQDAYSYHIDTSQPEASSVFVIADGVSSSTVSQMASDFATRQFIKLFKIAPEQFSIKTCAETIIKEINGLLYTRTQKSPFAYTPEKGYVCTLTVVILTGNQLDVFHVGDGDVTLFSSGDKTSTSLTRPHRETSRENPSHSYLSNAIGIKAHIDIDHTYKKLTASSSIAISTDGVHEFIALSPLLRTVNEGEELQENKAAMVVHDAFNKGSDDNLTLILIKAAFQQDTTTDALGGDKRSTYATTAPLTIAQLHTGDKIDGLTITRQLYTSARSHVFLATPATLHSQALNETNLSPQVVIKTPATDFTQTPEALSAFVLENWLARRVNSPHVIKSPQFTDLGLAPSPTAFYSICEYVRGQTLAQWAIDNPTPTLEQVRDIVEQIAKGLQAMHRQGILHRDIRLENIMISPQGHCTIIDFGAAALIEAPSLYSEATIPGTALFAAPEYFLGNIGSERSDMFSLAVLTYYLLCGRYPYQTKLAHCRTYSAQRKLNYESALDAKRPVPTWVDSALKRALHINPDKRYSSISEFVYSLRYPNPSHNSAYIPLVKRHPLLVYKALVLTLIFSNLITLFLFT